MKSLKDRYQEEFKSTVKTKLAVTNDFAVPRLDKIVINFGLGESASNAKTLENAIRDLEKISGQKPVITRSKKAISGFKIREDQAIGLKVTLRGSRMYNFLSKLINIALPRIRDFQGVSAKSFDGRGNYSLGLREQLVFPEIKYDQVDAVRGMDITICTTSTTDEGAKVLLEVMGMPFKGSRKKSGALAA